jgi:hypothetical protein
MHRKVLHVNTDSVAQTIGVSVDADLCVYDGLSPACSQFANRTALSAFSIQAWLNVFCRGHPLIVDADTYCLGLYSNRTSTVWNQVSVSSCSGNAGMALS